MLYRVQHLGTNQFPCPETPFTLLHASSAFPNKMANKDPYDYDYDWHHLNYSLENKDYYGVLEVEQSATAAQIKTAFNKLALRFHPDKNNGNKQAEEVFKRVR